MPAPTPEIGATVLYVPDRIHELDCDHQGHPVFHFTHDRAGRTRKSAFHAGDPVADFKALGRFRRRQGDRVQTESGHRLVIGAPRFFWRATVREVFADGTLALDIVHPRGWPILHYPRHGAAAGLRYSAAFEPHTWHLPEDELAQKGA